MANNQPKLGHFGVTVVRTTLPGFVQRTLLGRPKLTTSKYLGAYTAIAGQGILLGLRFGQVPLAAVKLVCAEGGASDLAGELRRQAANLAAQFSGGDVDFFEISTLTERARLLSKLGVAEPSHDPSALERYLSKATVNYETAYVNLVGCFARFLGLGLFEPEWIRPAYLRSMPAASHFEADIQRVEQLVRSWVSEREPALLPGLFPVVNDRYHDR